jgi:hypothetical protein
MVSIFFVNKPIHPIMVIMSTNIRTMVSGLVQWLFLFDTWCYERDKVGFLYQSESEEIDSILLVPNVSQKNTCYDIDLFFFPTNLITRLYSIGFLRSVRRLRLSLRQFIIIIILFRVASLSTHLDVFETRFRLKSVGNDQCLSSTYFASLWLRPS